MGADFVDKATPSFTKSWDRARVALATADLFTRAPSCAARIAAAEIVDNAKLRIGERLTVERDGDGLVALRGAVEVARFSNPSVELMKAVVESCGVAKGVVEQVHDLARVAEISLC